MLKCEKKFRVLNLKLYNCLMSGHSKWSTIKRQKAAADAVRGAIFTKLGKAITVAVKKGGGITDPQANFRLRLAIEKAHQANMPKSNIERAIARATAKGGADNLEEVVYEGYGPHGAAVIAEGVTDNKMRTLSQVKNYFAAHGGNLGQTGSVTFLFDKVGEIRLEKAGYDANTVLEQAVECGAEDVEEDDNSFIVYTKPQMLNQVKTCFANKKYRILDHELTYRPKSLITITDANVSQKIIEFLTNLENMDDIQKVHTNVDFKTEKQ